MKNFLAASIASLGLGALAGCADNSQSQSGTASTSSVTMSGDSKNMTGNTVTQEAPPPPDNTTSSTTTSATAGYPAIHSNGQGY